jgi:biotin carboxylase
VSTPKTIVMVDVYAPTMRLAQGFLDAGCTVARVQSTPEIPPVYRASFNTDLFCDNIIHFGDLDKTLEAVAKHEPFAVITGGELGVELADQLSQSLGLATNGTVHSEARRNKFVQIETLRAAGLRGTRQLLVTGEDELAAWHDEIGGQVVLKPIRSAGNDGVTFCATATESVAAYRSLAGRTNIFAVRNEGVVAQEYLAGAEYAVNTVSRDGRHRITDIWKYTKISVNGVVDRHSGAHSIPVDDPAREILAEHSNAVLDALGVRHGPAHLEIMLTPQGPRLVEAGIRLCGADTAYYAHLAAGESQIEWTVDTYLNPDRFLAEHRRPYRLRQHVAMAFLTAPVAGVLRSYPLLDEVRALESFHNVHIGVQPGDPLPKTVDDCSEPLMVGLAHPVAEVVARDLASVNYLDGRGFYELEPEGVRQ